MGLTVRNGWIGVDLDGTLAKYAGWQSPGHIGEPVPAIIARIHQVLELGFTVKVFTARMANPEQRAEFLQGWIVWSQTHIGTVLEATCCKDFAMIELWDDRCVAVEPNTGKFLTPSRILPN